ncbi:MAG TPA: amidase [Isosphaeraceae bacterium]|nr:amidase [Isosphaeraceae bacterium]
MKLFPDDHDTIAGTARRLRQGETTCVDVLQSCLERIAQREHEVRAWVLVDREGALAQARDLEAELQAGRDRGPLHGIPIGVKDIIDVKGLPTGCGSPRGTEQLAVADATIVTRLRDAGAVILGKTVTTAYAWIDPPVSRNPWSIDRTPGGSSSGSAAAVACGMCLGAIGTQTGGSITRPAAFCGVAGMKPTFGHVSTTGVFPFAPSLDHPGPIARSVDDLRTIYQSVCDRGLVRVEARQERDFGQSPPRLGRLGGFFDARAHAEMRWAMGASLSWFKGWGAAVFELTEPGFIADLLSHHRAIMAAESAQVHGERFALLPKAYLPRITKLIIEGGTIPKAVVELAHGLKARYASMMLALIDDLDALITPAAIGPAPDRSSTGDPAFNSPWSYLGFPTVSFPIGFSAERLPLGVQLIGRPGSDLELLRVAGQCEQWTHSAHRV